MSLLAEKLAQLPEPRRTQVEALLVALIDTLVVVVPVPRGPTPPAPEADHQAKPQTVTVPLPAAQQDSLARQRQVAERSIRTRREEERRRGVGRQIRKWQGTGMD